MGVELHHVEWEGISLVKDVFIDRGESMHIKIVDTDTVVRVTHQDGVLIEVDRKDGCSTASFSVSREDGNGDG